MTTRQLKSRMLLAACAFVFIGAVAVPARGEEQKHIAVLEFELAEGVKLDRVALSDLARSSVNTRAPQLFVMTRESTEALLQANGKSMADCTGECEVEVGRKLGADYIISGRITKLGSYLLLTMRLFSTSDGRLLSSADAKGKSVDSLVEKCDAALAKLTEPLAGLMGATRATGKAAAPAAGDVRVEPKSGLEFVYIPGGSFHMGCEPQDTQCQDNEKPGRTASVSAFWLGKTDVTVAAYTECVQAGACEGSIRGTDDDMHTCNWKNGRMDHPMNCINWKESRKFCAWAGGRLPTAEEWEYAAKSGESRVFPWGDQPVNGRLANYCDKNCPNALNDEVKKHFNEQHWIDYAQDDGYAGTSPVGNYPAGATKWGLLDMAGNVLQWTASDYDASNKELRGGSWYNLPLALRASLRSGLPPSGRYNLIGLRCGL